MATSLIDHFDARTAWVSGGFPEAGAPCTGQGQNHKVRALGAPRVGGNPGIIREGGGHQARAAGQVEDSPWRETRRATIRRMRIS